MLQRGMMILHLDTALSAAHVWSFINEEIIILDIHSVSVVIPKSRTRSLEIGQCQCFLIIICEQGHALYL